MKMKIVLKKNPRYYRYVWIKFKTTDISFCTVIGVYWIELKSFLIIRLFMFYVCHFIEQCM